jgi:hypothetical protein
LSLFFRVAHEIEKMVVAFVLIVLPSRLNVRLGQVPAFPDNLPDTVIGCPVWVMLTGCPATVSVPVRGEVVVFAATA